MFTTDLVNLYNRKIFKTSLYIKSFKLKNVVLCAIYLYLWFNTTTFIQNFTFINDTVLYQFFETDRCFICIVQRLRFSGLILYLPFIFLYSPFKVDFRSSYFILIMILLSVYIHCNLVIKQEHRSRFSGAYASSLYVNFMRIFH